MDERRQRNGKDREGKPGEGGRLEGATGWVPVGAGTAQQKEKPEAGRTAVKITRVHGGSSELPEHWLRAGTVIIVTGLSHVDIRVPCSTNDVCSDQVRKITQYGVNSDHIISAGIVGRLWWPGG